MWWTLSASGGPNMWPCGVGSTRHGRRKPGRLRAMSGDVTAQRDGLYRSRRPEQARWHPGTSWRLLVEVSQLSAAAVAVGAGVLADQLMTGASPTSPFWTCPQPRSTAHVPAWTGASPPSGWSLRTCSLAAHASVRPRSCGRSPTMRRETRGRRAGRDSELVRLWPASRCNPAPRTWRAVLPTAPERSSETVRSRPPDGASTSAFRGSLLDPSLGGAFAHVGPPTVVEKVRGGPDVAPHTDLRDAALRRRRGRD